MKIRPCALLWRHTNSQTEILLLHYRYGGCDVYALPGGNPDRGETLPQTVAREVTEEIGVTVEIGELVMTGEVLRPQLPADMLHLVFAARNLRGEPCLNPAHTTALAIVWKSLDDLEQLTLYPNVGRAIHRWFSQDLVGAGYIGPIDQPYFD